MILKNFANVWKKDNSALAIIPKKEFKQLTSVLPADNNKIMVCRSLPQGHRIELHLGSGELPELFSSLPVVPAEKPDSKLVIVAAVKREST